MADVVRAWASGETMGQLLRFAIAGLGVTLWSIGVYLTCASVLRIEPMIANAISHGAGVAAGYALHSRWSFRAGGKEGAALRFIVCSAVAFALNATWVWLAVHALRGPAWLPVPAMMMLTPLASFAINKFWVFAEA